MMLFASLFGEVEVGRMRLKACIHCNKNKSLTMLSCPSICRLMSNRINHALERKEDGKKWSRHYPNNHRGLAVYNGSCE